MLSARAPIESNIFTACVLNLVSPRFARCRGGPDSVEDVE
jgi:hypothetical protein